MTAPGATTRLKVLTVCTHNRTRSVMMAAMLEKMLAAELGARAVLVRSSGFGPVGLPAIPEAIDAMARRGLDVSGHRSGETTKRLVDGADVIFTAERDHVVRIATLSPATFRRAMTLPEFLDRAATFEEPSGSAAGSTAGEPHDAPDRAPAAVDRIVRDRVTALTAGRPAGGYLRAPVPEIDDPTGSARRVFEAAVVELERQCGEAARLLAGYVTAAG